MAPVPCTSCSTAHRVLNYAVARAASEESRYGKPRAATLGEIARLKADIKACTAAEHYREERRREHATEAARASRGE